MRVNLWGEISLEIEKFGSLTYVYVVAKILGCKKLPVYTPKLQKSRRLKAVPWGRSSI